MLVQKTLFVLLLSVPAVSAMEAQQKRAIVPQDCVQVRYLKNGFDQPIEISPQGDRVAYLLIEPDLATNRNRVALYIKSLGNPNVGPARLLKQADDISQIHWSADGNFVVALVKSDDHGRVEDINILDGQAEVLFDDPRGIDEFTVDSAASTIVYSTESQSHGRNASRETDDTARGYEIELERPTASLFRQHNLYLVTRMRDGSWSEPRQITFLAPFSAKRIDTFSAVYTLNLSLSPDGQYLLFRYLVSDPIPDEWKKSPYVRNMIIKAGFTISILVLVDLHTDNSSIPLATPEPWSIPLWSTDSRSFAVVSAAPVGTSWERQDYAKAPNSYGPGHLFLVTVKSGEIEEVTDKVANIAEQPLAWEKGGDLVIHTAANTVSTFTRTGSSWHESNSIVIPLPDRYRYGRLAADREQIVGDYQTTTVPPELFQYSVKSHAISTLEKLNPQFDQLALAQAKRIHWKIPDGSTIDGLLLLPPNYTDSKKYPLVIQTKPEYGQFLCDSGQDHFPAFEPEPIANAGMLYLIRSLPSSDADRNDVPHYPKGYPGQIGEAAFHMQIWDSAVASLASQGMIDPGKVGIIGFSRAGWYTEFMLMNSSTHYAAATASDNVQYSLGEYWIDHSDGLLHSFEAMYGGSPYGPAIENWKKYSITFNMSKIHTPLLMEVMGEAIPYNYDKAPPLKLAASFEVFTGLKRLDRPVQLYYYPEETHEMDHPQALLGSLQRNLDWYRWWLEGIPSSQRTPSAESIR